MGKLAKVKEVAKAQLPKLITLVLIIADIFAIFFLSSTIAPDRHNLTTQNVIGFTQVHLALVALSAVLIVSLFYFFTKMLFNDQREEFNLKEKDPKAYILAPLTLLFVAQVFILLDVGLVNIYISTAGITLYWMVASSFGPIGTDLQAYALIRSEIFTVFFLILLAVPLFMFLVIFSRDGRKMLSEVKRPNLRKYGKVTSAFLVLNTGFTALTYLAFSETFVLADVIGIYVAYFALFVFFLILIEILRLIFQITSSYLIMVLPIFAFFYLLPVLLWTIWDMIILYTGGDVLKTIYAGSTPPPLSDSTSLALTTLVLNLTALPRILELDFVFIVGGASLVIGFAEGYSLLSIVKGVVYGRKITKAGRVIDAATATRTVRVTRSIMLLTWFSLLWDKSIETLRFMTEDLSFPFDFAIDLPTINVIVLNFSFVLDQQFFLPATFLILPAIIIVNASFKFLSVGLVTSYTKDAASYTLIMAAAFLLIILKIYVDISSTALLGGEASNLLPLADIGTSPFIAFTIKVLNNLEAVAFFSGLLVVLSRPIWARDKKEEKTDDA